MGPQGRSESNRAEGKKMAYRYSQLSGRLRPASQLAAYKPQGIQSHVLPTVTVSQPTQKAQPVRKQSTGPQLIRDSLQNIEPKGWWAQERLHTHELRKRKVQWINRISDKHGEGKELAEYYPVGKFRIWLLIAFGIFALTNTTYTWQSGFKGHEYKRMFKVKF